MSLVRVIAIRRLNEGLRSQATASPWWQCAPRLKPIGRPHVQVIAIQQCRHQSTSGDKNGRQQQPNITTKMILRALWQNISLRPLMNAFRGQTFKSIYRQSPEELVLAIILLSCMACIVVYVIYTYFNYFQSEQFTRLPPEVAKSMRRALYYSNYGPDPALALKYYKLALEQCDQVGLDPFSDEVMGIKIQLAFWLEKTGRYNSSIQVLDALLQDCKRWIEKMEQAAREGQIDKSGILIGVPAPKPPKQQDGSVVVEIREPENLWAKRTRILGKAMGISVKLGGLYADEHVLQKDLAGPHLIWAVETALKELHRREVEGLKEGEGEWGTPEEIGGSFEALANHYESKSQHYLAAPLYLQAITLSPPNSCHTAVLMNNLAISLAQQPVLPPEEGSAGGQQQPTRATLLASARSWALQAHATGSKIVGEDRTPECDEACAVALCNLGEIAAMSGDMEEANRKFKDSLALSKRIAFKQGIQQAQDGLDAATSMPSKKTV